MADYNVGTVEVRVQTAAENALKALDALTAKLNEVAAPINALSPALASINSAAASLNKKNLSSFNSGLKRASDTTKKLSNDVKQTQDSFGKLLSVAKIGALVAIGRRIGNALAGVFQKSIDFIETANLFQVSMKGMYYEALRFNNEMSRALGLNQEQLMRYQAVFNNMLNALPGLTREVSYQLSEVLTKAAVDYAALFNVSIENSMNAWKAMLSGQVRPIRNASGFDTTEVTIFEAYKELYERDGLMPPKTMRQLDQIEKRLLRILSAYQQMYSTDAIANYALTVEQPAQQLKVLVTQLEEIGRWFGTIFLNILGEALPTINGVLITFKEVLRSIAYFSGWRLEFVRSDDPLAEITQGADEASEAIERLQNKLFSFDRFESLQSTTASSSGLGVDEKILEAIQAAMQEYDNKMSAISMRANEISESMLKWLGYIPVEELDEAGERTGAIVWQLKEGLTRLDEWMPAIKAIGAVLAVGVTSKIAGLLTGLLGIGKVLGAAKSLISPLGAIIAIIGYGYATNDSFRESVNKLAASLYNLSEKVLKSVVKALDALLPTIETLLNLSIPILTFIVDTISAVLEFLDTLGILEPALLVLAGTVLAVKLIGAIKTAITWIKGLSLATGVLYAAIALLAFQVLNLIANWDKMSGIERVVGILGAVAAAATIAAFAIAGLQSAWTLGLGAAAIVAGIVSISLALNRSNQQAKQQANAAQNIPGYATGGYPTAGQLFVANEKEVELIGHQGSRPVVANNNQIFDGIRAGVYEAVSGAMGGGGGTTITFDFKNANDSALARVIRDALSDAYRKSGSKVGG